MRRSIETNSSSLKQMPWHHRSDAITLLPRLLVSVALLLEKDMSRQMTGGTFLSDLFCLMRILFLDQH
jgi:hypothetical protein